MAGDGQSCCEEVDNVELAGDEDDAEVSLTESRRSRNEWKRMSKEWTVVRNPILVTIPSSMAEPTAVVNNKTRYTVDSDEKEKGTIKES